MNYNVLTFGTILSFTVTSNCLSKSAKDASELCIVLDTTIITQNLQSRYLDMPFLYSLKNDYKESSITTFYVSLMIRFPMMYCNRRKIEKEEYMK